MMDEPDNIPQLTTPELKLLKTAFLVGAYRAGSEVSECNDHLDELKRLCDTYGLEVLDQECCPYRKLDAGTFLGSGKLEELKEKVDELKAEVIIFDDEISPQQQRNLEKLFKKPVIDRTELIIEVFAQRALTREARLQVEVAKIRYQLPRLRRLWTHLSRQAGSGKGFVKGEGEKQIELDRRMLRRRIDRLLKQIKEIRAQRQTQRHARLRSQIPTFAIVGYTNAGKSTLLKALTDADVLVEDKLFATLDTKTRKFTLSNGQAILLIDTVGFIRKIPHTVVAAFRGTLEEVLYTDILLHIVDVSNSQAEEQINETLEVLKELGASDKPVITVLNKIDLCERDVWQRYRIRYPKTVPISAVTKEGFDHLQELMVQELSNLRQLIELRIPQSEYALISEINEQGKVIDIEYEDNDIIISAEVPTQILHKVERFKKRES